MRRTNPLVLLLPLIVTGCNRKAVDANGPFTADIAMDGHIPGAPRLTGTLYLSNGHLRADWGVFADVFDLRLRRG